MWQARRHRSSSSRASIAIAAAPPGLPTTMGLQRKSDGLLELRPVQRMDSSGSACSQGSTDFGASEATVLRAAPAAEVPNAAGSSPAVQPRLCSLAALLEACGRCFLPGPAVRSLVATVAVRWHSGWGRLDAYQGHGW